MLIDPQTVPCPMRRSCSSRSNPRLASRSTRTGEETPFNNTNAVFRKEATTTRRLDNASHIRSLLNDVSISKNRNGPVSSGGVRRISSAPAIRRIQQGGGNRFPPGSPSGTLSAASSNNSLASSISSGSYQTNIVIAQRSNAGTVKSFIADIQRLCQEAEAERDSTIQPPIDQCASLSHLSVDAYYKVVISKYQGIEAMCTAMRTFPDSAELQACCCACLKNLSNIVAIHSAGGHLACFKAMKNHPTSIQVQSEACEALHHLHSLLFSSDISKAKDYLVDGGGAPAEEEMIHQIDQHEFKLLLSHAQNMYLTTKGKESCFALLNFVSKTQQMDDDNNSNNNTQAKKSPPPAPAPAAARPAAVLIEPPPPPLADAGILDDGLANA
jgi:hypothetical protein